jgi:hypothetical protein
MRVVTPRDWSSYMLWWCTKVQGDASLGPVPTSQNQVYGLWDGRGSCVESDHEPQEGKAATP